MTSSALGGGLGRPRRSSIPLQKERGNVDVPLSVLHFVLESTASIRYKSTLPRVEWNIGYFKRPTLETLKAVTKVAKSDEVEAGKVMFDNCWLGGSQELRTDALLFMAVQKKLGEVLNGFQGLIKNL